MDSWFHLSLLKKFFSMSFTFTGILMLFCFIFTFEGREERKRKVSSFNRKFWEKVLNPHHTITQTHSVKSSFCVFFLLTLLSFSLYLAFFVCNRPSKFSLFKKDKKKKAELQEEIEKLTNEFSRKEQNYKDEISKLQSELESLKEQLQQEKQKNQNNQREAQFSSKSNKEKKKEKDQIISTLKGSLFIKRETKQTERTKQIPVEIHFPELFSPFRGKSHPFCKNRTPWKRK